MEFTPKTLITSNSFLHRSLLLYEQLGHYTHGADLTEYKLKAHEDIIRLFPNGNI